VQALTLFFWKILDTSPRTISKLHVMSPGHLVTWDRHKRSTCDASRSSEIGNYANRGWWCMRMSAQGFEKSRHNLNPKDLFHQPWFSVYNVTVLALAVAISWPIAVARYWKACFFKVLWDDNCLQRVDIQEGVSTMVARPLPSFDWTWYVQYVCLSYFHLLSMQQVSSLKFAHWITSFLNWMRSTKSHWTFQTLRRFYRFKTHSERWC